MPSPIKATRYTGKRFNTFHIIQRPNLLCFPQQKYKCVPLVNLTVLSPGESPMLSPVRNSPCLRQQKVQRKHTEIFLISADEMKRNNPHNINIYGEEGSNLVSLE